MPGHGFPYEDDEHGDAWFEADLAAEEHEREMAAKDRAAEKAPMRPRGVERRFTDRERRAG